jgi:signal peptidase I
MLHGIKLNRGFFVAPPCVGVCRTAVADWKPMPSASMRPTRLEGHELQSVAGRLSRTVPAIR